MHKIIVLGNSGSGKSTLTVNLAKKLGYDYLHLDPIVYKYSWDKPEFDEMEEKVKLLLEKENWISDGNFLNNALKRFDECDTVFFLDINRFVCLRSVIKRHRQYKGKHRESRSDYCDELITKNYLKWVFSDFYKTSRKTILKYIKDNTNKKIIIFKSRRQINKYIKEIYNKHHL